MKLLQILYPGLGGHSSVAFSLIEGDISKVFSHQLLGYGIEKPSESYVSKCQEYNITPFYVVKKIGFDVASLWKSYRKLKEINPDYIIMHSTSLILIVWWYSFLNRKRFISVEHQTNQIKTKVDWLYTLLIAIFSSKVVYLTESYGVEVKNKIRSFYNNNKTLVINNGINISKFKPNLNQTKSNDSIVISMIARITSSRDQKTLIEAFAEISDQFSVVMYLAGDGAMKNELEEYVEQLHLNDKIVFTGSINENEVISLIQKTDIYVHSSLGETLSTSILQIMACKIPIIATDIPGINNLLTRDNEALLFEPKNKVELINSIKKLINDKDLAKYIANNAYSKLIENFSCIKMFEEYKKCLLKNNI